MFLANNKGFNFIQLLIATTVFTIVSIGVMNLMVYYSRVRQEQKLQASIISARYTLLSFLQHEKAWVNTVMAPENDTTPSDCLTGDTSDTGVGSDFDCFGVGQPGGAKPPFPIPLAVFDPAGNIYYDSRGVISTSHGFSRDGVVCDAFDKDIGDFNCPFQVRVQWKALCTASPCYKPGIEIEVLFSISQSTGDQKISFNPDNYNFTILK